MAEKILKGINFPGLEDTYLIPEVDDTLSKPGASADAKVVGEALSGKQPIGNYVKTINGTAPDENGNVTIEVRSEGGSGSTGGSNTGEAIQSDWDSNDSESESYIKNRPFYHDPLVTVLSEREYEWLLHDAGYSYTLFNDVAVSLVAGETYDVTLNGTCYTKIAYASAVNECIVLGNEAIATDDAAAVNTGDEFVFMAYLNGNNLIATTLDLGNNAVSITQGTGELKKLDSKFLPDGIATEEFVMNAIENSDIGSSGSTGSSGPVSWNDILDKPFGEGEPVLKELMPSTTVPFTYDPSGGEPPMFVAPASAVSSTLADDWASDWSMCTVVWDGTAYECAPQYLEGMKCIGDIKFMIAGTPSENGEPFIIVVGDIQGDGTQYLLAYSLSEIVSDTLPTESTTLYHTISSGLLMPSINPLDSKYISEVSWSKITDKPFYTIPAGTVLADETAVCVEAHILPLTTFDYSQIIVDCPYSIVINDTTCNGIGVSYGALILIQGTDSDFFISDMYGGLVDDGGQLSLSAGTEYTVQIVVSSDFIKKIPEEYLPDDLGGSSLPEIDSSGADAGKVLTVDSTGAATWSTPASGLPEVTAQDAGKFLRVTDEGIWAAVAMLDVSEVGL